MKPYRTLLAHECITPSDASYRIVHELTQTLKNRNIDVLTASHDPINLFDSDAGLSAVLVSWTLPQAELLIHQIRNKNLSVPIFLLIEKEEAQDLSTEILKLVSELVWIFEDSSHFIAGRIEASMVNYRKTILGPMASALIDFNSTHEYSWHTPGHAGGTAFQKSPAGREFWDYFGENLFRSDLSISVGELGSLLDHSGPIGESEKYSARVFGADRTYTVTNGSSTANRIIWTACVARGQRALVDRNCHKSNEQGLTLTGAIPQYLMPTRNRYGIIGPIPLKNLEKESLMRNGKPSHCVITNSTYDGLIYQVEKVLDLLAGTVDRIHFDEAWYGYARFHPLYKNRYAMRGTPAQSNTDSPTLFATHSTHKLLAALSQASFIHVRDGLNAIDHNRFNESFMMHASTSPFYPIIASNDITTSMMDGPGGEALMEESIREAILFRQMVTRIWREYDSTQDWFFQTWNPTHIQETFFEKVPVEELVKNAHYWELKPGETWHGFDYDAGYCMLDPIKVSVLSPGIRLDGSLDIHGFPACLLTAYLDSQGIQVEKTNDFSILFLFSLGVTHAKWSTLLHHLMEFKRLFDENAPLSVAIPALSKHYPSLGLQDLARPMMQHLIQTDFMKVQHEAFSILPSMNRIPAEAYQALLRNEIERVSLKEAQGRIAATGLVPYPPGIPMIMPGEEIGTLQDPWLGYLAALESWDQNFPGFSHDIHGIEFENGCYKLSVLR
ncbi:MAG: arginine decarboxylase [Myxococcaceae bacterium]|nr:arginine decarboxylase [Myxococcaceae bacterium]MBH2006011.1 arginine decarboxylase [Myxococcaceae bacterium]